MSAQQPKAAHLNGSVPLGNSETVFRTVSSTLGDRLRRIPDGETGVRTNWIGFQSEAFAATDKFDLVPPDPKSYAPLPFFIPRAGVDPRQIRFGRLGYADAAKASYEKFAALKREGQILAGTRFQVSLPTPLAPVAAFVAPDAVPAVEPAYEAALLAELDEIIAAVPHDELAIQWDAAVEFAMLEGVWPVKFTDVRREVLDRLVRIGNRVPADAELGYHLCYGDAGHKHFKEPADVSKLVDIANATPTLRRSESSGCPPRPSSTWAWSTSPMGWRAQSAASRPRNGPSTGRSAWPPSAGWDAGRRRRSRNCFTSMPRSRRQSANP
jgi:hypothetical protein